MELPPKNVRTVFSVVKVGELTGKPRTLAEEVIGELSEEHSISLDRRSSLLAVVNASKKLNKRSRRDAKLLKKMERLVMMCSSTLKGGEGGQKGGALEEAKGETRKRAELGAGKEAPEGLALKTKLSPEEQDKLNKKFLEAAEKPATSVQELKELLA